ncbi:MAG: hypothetical protein SFY67_08485 [Candidatus Melainabacteria bacterium]|nr:hypothetical protein [Candidatus Melainabacteria bacterium]
MKGEIANCVKAYINRLDFEALFATQELLKFGHRTAVDQCLYVLCKNEYIKRISHGIYLKCDKRGRFREPSTEEVLRRRAELMGLRVVKHMNGEEVVFLINGKTRTVVINGKTIELKRACNRKLNLGESRAGNLLRQFWFEGKIESLTIREDPNKMARLRHLNPVDRDELRQAATYIPDWLNKAINQNKFGSWIDDEARFKRLQALHRD